MCDVREEEDLLLEANLRAYFELHPEARPANADEILKEFDGDVDEEQREREIESINRWVRRTIQRRKSEH